MQIEVSKEHEGQTISLPLMGKARLRLQTIGPGQFEKPIMSGSGVAFEGGELQAPPNPGGPTQIYVFACIQPGTVMVSIPHSASGATFNISFSCNPGSE